MMEHFFAVWQDFIREAAAAHVLFLADYDGTLVPIAPTPAEARLTSRVREKLRALAGKPAFSVGIISGRALGELKAMVGIAGIYYAGNHGLEIEGPGLCYVHPQASAGREVIRGLAAELTAALGDIHGVIIQDKGLSLSVHYRLLKAEDTGKVEETVRRLTGGRHYRGRVVLSSGKKVWEIRLPVAWDKGKAVATIAGTLRKRLGGKRLLTLFLGDDITDEDAFRVVQPPAGWGIYIGGRNAATTAGYYLDSTDEVVSLLERLTALG